ncbi:MAG TPA: FHA domain-containing protein [Leptolyngbyaceae cyanobacterium]
MYQLNLPEQLQDRSLKFLEQNSSFLLSLVSNCKDNLEIVSTIIQPILNAPKRCDFVPYYIQAVNTGITTFMVTNLCDNEVVKIIDSDSSWLIGRRSTCAISILNPSISRQHAMIGHEFGNQFYISDMGSKNGTKINHRQLSALERSTLCDGDLIELGSLSVQFFVATYQPSSPIEPEEELTDLF